MDFPPFSAETNTNVATCSRGSLATVTFGAVAPGGDTDCPVLLSPVPGVRVGGRLCPVQVLPAGGEHGDQRVLPGRRLHDAAVPGSLPVDEGPPAVPQPGLVGEAQVPVNYPECTAARDRAMTRDVWIRKCEQDIFLSVFNIYIYIYTHMCAGLNMCICLFYFPDERCHI